MADDVRSYSTLEDVAHLRDDWDRLLAATPQATFFQTLDWLTVYWQHHGDSRQLRILVVYRDEHPIGIVPLTVYWEQTRIGSIRVLGYPLDHWGTSFGPLGAQPRETLFAALGWIRRHHRQWDVLDLRWATGLVAQASEAALKDAGLPATRRAAVELSWIDLSQGWEAYWGSRTGKLRNNVRRGEKRLAEMGQLESIHCRPTDGDARWDLYKQCGQVSASSWQAAVTTGTTLSDPPVRSFLVDVHRAAVARNAAAMNLLTLDGQPIAFSYDYVFQHQVYGLRTGFDPKFARAGPGAVLMARSLRACCRRGDHTIDLGETPAAYKTKWRTATGMNFRFCHYPRLALRAQALRWKRHLCDSRLATSECGSTPLDL